MPQQHYQLGSKLISVDAPMSSGNAEHLQVLEREGLQAARPIPMEVFHAQMFDKSKQCVFFERHPAINTGFAPPEYHD